MTTASFSKLRDGSWGIRVVDYPLPIEAGDEFTITTRDGSIRSAIVSRVVWTDGRTSLCAIRQQARRARPAERAYWDGRYGSSSYYSSGQYDLES